MATDSRSNVEALFLAHQARIYGFISSMVPNRADAEDLLQETGLVIFSHADDFRPGTNFMAWACQIAHNKILNHRTRQRRSPLRFSDEFLLAVGTYQLAHLDDAAEEYAALARCLEKLPDRDRVLIEQCYYSGATIKQVAVQMGRPPNVLYKRLKLIREELRRCVQGDSAREASS